MSNMFWFDAPRGVASHKHPHDNNKRIPSKTPKQRKSQRLGEERYERGLIAVGKHAIKNKKYKGKTLELYKRGVLRAEISREDRRFRPDKTRVKRFSDGLYKFAYTPSELAAEYRNYPRDVAISRIEDNLIDNAEEIMEGFEREYISPTEALHGLERMMPTTPGPKSRTFVGSLIRYIKEELLDLQSGRDTETALLDVMDEEDRKGLGSWI